MILDALGLDRLEGAGTDVQRDGGDLDPRRLERLEHLAREVQPRGRGRHRSRLGGVDGLVPVAVLGQRRALEVGRQRHGAVALEHLEHRHREAQHADAVLAAGLDQDLDRRRRSASTVPGASFFAGRAMARQRSGSSPSSRSSSTLPPPGERTASRRAGRTRVSFTTTRSPRRSRAGSSATVRCRSLPAASSTSRRALPRATGVRAIRSSGSV